MNESGLPHTSRTRVAIVGAGFGGIAMAHRLKRAGIDDFVVLERSGEVGGCWRENDYPGCACDVPSLVYSLSFAPNPDWSRTYSPQAEILAYLKRSADEFGVTPHVDFRRELASATWDAGAEVWRLETSRGPLVADVLVAAMGPLAVPAFPRIKGLETFRGRAFHSAEWDHEFDLEGKRVAVIGTGASAIQFVPAIQPRVGSLKVFQRTASWVLPRSDRPVSRFERRLYRALPLVQRAARAANFWARETMVLGFRNPRLMGIGERLARRHLRRQVPDPVLRAKLTPDFRLGCKRVLLSNDYLSSLSRPNVELVTAGITAVKPSSVVTADGVEHEVDAIIFGTGFQVLEMPAARLIRGQGGRLLSEAWTPAPRAYAGTTVTGFPNLFFLLGPNTGLGHNSVVYMEEAQTDYVLDCLRAMDRHNLATVDVKPEALARYNDFIQRRSAGTVWTTGGCASYYVDENGVNGAVWPGFSASFRGRLRRFDIANYVVSERAGGAEQEVAAA